MKTTFLKTPLMLAGALAGASAAMADVSVSVSAEIRVGKVAPPPPPLIEIVDAPQPKGPPPWAPAHGLRRNRDYYFYPACHVYYRPADRMWFFLDGGDWKAGVQLPTSLQIDFSHSVKLTMETDQPYAHHKDVVVLYPRDYFAKVKIKAQEKHEEKHEAKPEKAREKESGKERGAEKKKQKAERDDDDGDDRAGGHGKGKGKNK